MIKSIAVCDNCGKEQQVDHKWESPIGWFSFNLAKDCNTHREMKDYEACSRKCLIEFINNFNFEE